MNSLDKFIQILKDHELVYKETCPCDSGFVEIRDAEQSWRDFAREFEAELAFRQLHKID